MANVGPLGSIKYVETFATDSLAGGSAGSSAGSAADGIAWIGSADTSDTAFVRAVNTNRGLHVAGALTTTDNNRVEFMSDQLMFTGQTGFSSVETLLQLDVVTDIAIFFGFNDAATGPGNIIPVKLATTTFTQNAADGCLGILLDVDATNDEFHCFWGNGGTKTTETAATLRLVGMGLTAAKWFHMKITMQDRGSGNAVRATFAITDHTGKSAEKTFNTSVDRDLPMNFYLGLENRAATAHNIYIKLPSWEQSIETV